MQKNMSAEASNKIQIMRGIAIVAVVAIHNLPTGIIHVWLRPFLNFSVGLFLFLSGMLSQSANWHPKKRIVKVLVPYIIWTLIYEIIAYHGTPSKLPLKVLQGLLTAKSSAVMYYVFVYVELTLLIPLVDRLARSKLRWLGFVVSPIEIIVMRLLPIAFGFTLNRYVLMIMDVSCVPWFSYYFFGYLLGNRMIKISLPASRLFFLWLASIGPQILEGYIYYLMGEENCGTQLKLSSILSGMLFVAMAYQLINNERGMRFSLLRMLGDCSFGIYFSHLAWMGVLGKTPYFHQYVVFPLNALITIAISLIFVLLVRKLLGKYSALVAF